MQETQECVAPSVPHQYDWFFSETGMTLWKCILCKTVITENEDCQL